MPGKLRHHPSVYKGILYVGEGCNQQGSNVVALRDSDGSLVWTREVTGVPHGLTVADGIIAYVRFDGTTDYIGALSASHGKPIWGPTAVNNVGFWSMPAIAYQQIYAWIFINDYGYVADYTKRLGALNWQYTVARSFPSVANHVLYFAFNGSPLALNAATGQYLWNIGGTDNFGLPIIVDGVLYGGCSGTNVCAYGLPNDRSHVHIGEVPAKAHSP